MTATRQVPERVADFKRRMILEHHAQELYVALQSAAAALAVIANNEHDAYPRPSCASFARENFRKAKAALAQAEGREP